MGFLRKSIRISVITEALLKKLRPELEHHGAGYIVDVIIHEQSNLPPPLPPDTRRQKGAEKRGKQLKGKPAINQKGKKEQGERQ